METKFKINQEVYTLSFENIPIKAKIFKIIRNTSPLIYWVSYLTSHSYNSENLIKRESSDIFATPEDLKNYFIQLIDNL